MDYTNSQIRELIAEHIHSERDRKILERRLIDGIIFERLAEEFEMSVSQIKRIIMKGKPLQQYRHDINWNMIGSTILYVVLMKAI